MAVARRTSQRVTLVMLVLASATIITLDYKGDAHQTITSVRNAARDVVSPAQRLIADILHPVGDLFSGSVNYGDAQAQIVRLQQQIGTLQQQAEQEQQFDQEYRQILSLEHLGFSQNIPTVEAGIIAGTTSNFNEEIEIDKGTSSGIGPNMPVVASNGLAGFVVSAGGSTAMVELITDPRSSIGVRFGDDDLGVAGGAGAGADLDVALQSGEPVHTGEIVYTSGLLPAAYPADIPVGTVSSVQVTPGYTTSVTISPYVDFNDLQYVDVMQWVPPA